LAAKVPYLLSAAEVELLLMIVASFLYRPNQMKIWNVCG
jgi:hypothetical protein